MLPDNKEGGKSMYNFDRIKDMIYREMDGISDEGQLTFDCV